MFLMQGNCLHQVCLASSCNNLADGAAVGRFLQSLDARASVAPGEPLALYGEVGFVSAWIFPPLEFGTQPTCQFVIYVFFRPSLAISFSFRVWGLPQ